MAERTQFSQVVDGDYLSQGYFNEIRSAIGHAGVFSELSTINRGGEAFTANNVATSTGMAYDTVADEFYSTASSIVLETSSTLVEPTKNFQPVDTGYLKWDYYVATVYDECNDSSVDLTAWDAAESGFFSGVATLAEDTDKLSYTYTTGTNWDASNGYMRITTDGTNGTFTDETVVFRGFASTTADVGPGGKQQKLQIVGTTSGTVTLVTDDDTTTDAHYVVKFDSTNQKAWVWKNGAVLSGSPFDLSGITGSYMVRLETELTSSQTSINNAAAFQVVFYYFRVIDGTETTTLTESFSSDGGSNYTTASNNFANITSNAGYSMRAKLSGTVQTGEVVGVRRVDYLGLTSDEI